MRSLDRYNIISNNYYLDTCGTTVAIAKADQIDTARKLESDTIKYVTTDSYCRTDDPLGADAGKLGQAATAEQFADGTVAEGLNAGEGSFENWEQGEKYPVYGDEPVVYVESLSVTGYKDTYTTLEEFTTEGTVVTAVMSDGTKTEVPVEDAEFSGYINSVGTWAVTVTYKGCMTSFSVKVKKATDEQYAEHVDGLIEAIGEVTADSKDAIDTARAAYDKLTAAQKELITKYEILTAAEETYENLMKQYDIHIAEAENGSITASPESAREGMEVLLTVKPDEGYKQKSLTVTYFDGDTEKNVSVSGGKFKMPAADVTVTAEFKEVSRLASLQFASDADGKHVYELTPSFDKKTLTYQLEAGVPEYLTKIYYKAVPEAASDKITLKYQEVWGTNVTAAAIDKWEIRTLSGNPVTMTYKVGEKALYAWTFDNAVYPDITPYTVVINRRATLANLTTDDSMRPAKFLSLIHI